MRYKPLLAMLLASAAVLGNVSAVGAFEPAVPKGTEITGAATTGSGACGEGLTWTLGSDGLLTISGTGDMWDTQDLPWSEDNKSITRAVIENGARGIGSYAFSYCTSLQSVQMPAGMKRIGDRAFGNSSSLASRQSRKA